MPFGYFLARQVADPGESCADRQAPPQRLNSLLSRPAARRHRPRPPPPPLPDRPPQPLSPSVLLVGRFGGASLGIALQAVTAGAQLRLYLWPLTAWVRVGDSPACTASCTPQDGVGPTDAPGDPPRAYRCGPEVSCSLSSVAGSRRVGPVGHSSFRGEAFATSVDAGRFPPESGSAALGQDCPDSVEVGRVPAEDGPIWANVYRHRSSLGRNQSSLRAGPVHR